MTKFFTTQTMQIHEKIRQARLSAGLSPEELANKIGVARTTYLYWEDKTPSVKRIKQIEKALNLKEGYFFNGSDEKTDKEETPSEPSQETHQSLLDKMMKFIVLLMEKQNGLVETQTVVMNRQNTILEKNQEFVIEKIETISLTVEAIRQNQEKMIIEIKTSSNGIEGKFQVFEKTIVEKFSTLSQLVKDESRMGFHQQYEGKDKRNQTGNAGKRSKRGS